MPLTVKRSGRWTLRALLPWLVGAVPVVCGVLMMQWQAQRELEARALGATQQVLGHVERILDNIASAAKAAAEASHTRRLGKTEDKGRAVIQRAPGNRGDRGVALNPATRWPS